MFTEVFFPGVGSRNSINEHIELLLGKAENIVPQVLVNFLAKLFLYVPIRVPNDGNGRLVVTLLERAFCQEVTRHQVIGITQQSESAVDDPS